MTARVVLACDGQWPVGVRCRQAIPVGEAPSGARARMTAAAHGWSSRLNLSLPEGDRVDDLCPACSRRAAERTVRACCGP